MIKFVYFYVDNRNSFYSLIQKIILQENIFIEFKNFLSENSYNYCIIYALKSDL